MKLKDLAERLLWTVVAAAFTNLASVGLFDLKAWQAAAMAGINGAITFLLVVARWRLSVLPDPGEGLPGLPVEPPVSAAARLEELGLHDPEPTTGAPDAGQTYGLVIVVLLIVILVVLL